jgi:hypothetical protein
MLGRLKKSKKRIKNKRQPRENLARQAGFQGRSLAQRVSLAGVKACARPRFTRTPCPLGDYPTLKPLASLTSRLLKVN